MGGVEGEHQALAAQDHVVGLVGLVEVIQVQGQGADVAQPQGGGPGGGDRRHLGGHVRQHHLAGRADQAGGGDPMACSWWLFQARGYPATTMEQVADEAGVALKTVYVAFATKSGLLRPCGTCA